MKPVRVGVIGVGLWGTMHVEAYQALPHVQVIAIADAVPLVARRVAESHNIPHWFADYQDLCALDEIDAVSIVTPEAEHLEPVRAAAGAQKHFLVEKPIASTVDEAQAIVTAARDADVLLMPGHILRFENRYALIHEMLTSGELGRVVSIQAGETGRSRLGKNTRALTRFLR